MNVLRLEVHKQRHEIEVRAEVAGAWRKLEKWWGFREIAGQPYGDDTFWCRVELVLWSRDGVLGREKIKSLRYPAEGDSGWVKVQGGILSVVAPLREGWTLNRRGHPRYRRELQIPQVRLVPGPTPGKSIPLTIATFALEITILRLPPRSMTVPDEWEFGDGHALVGGLPGTKRRH
jgi:hypothetical protein